MRAPATSDVSPLALVVALVVVNLAGKAGDALAAVLVESRPLTLLALNANDAHMALTAGHTPFVPYVVVCVCRRLLEDPLYFFLGATRFAGAVRVLDDVSPGMRRKIEASKPWFERFSTLAVALEPGAVVCLLAGWSKMRATTFWSANVLGTLARVALVRRLGNEARTWPAAARGRRRSRGRTGASSRSPSRGSPPRRGVGRQGAREGARGGEGEKGAARGEGVDCRK